MRHSLTLMDLAPGQLASAAALCARAMRDNPVHVHCFGSDPGLRERRLQTFFSVLLPYGQRHGLLTGAYAGEQLVAVAGAMAPGGCRPAWADGLRMLPGMIRANSPRGLWRTAGWLQAWWHADPDEPHWHMGPLAVAPAWQGRGVVTWLARHLCRRALQQAPVALYLETDTRRNVRLYQAFGFQVTGMCSLAGTPSWLMRRAPSAHWGRDG